MVRLLHDSLGKQIAKRQILTPDGAQVNAVSGAEVFRQGSSSRTSMPPSGGLDA